MTVHVPECLKPYAANPAWVAWSLTGADRRKVPLSPLTGKAASSTAPDTWAPLDAALRMTRAARFQPPQGGVGLVSAAVPDLVFLDLDRCLNPLHPDAARLLEACPTYSEITPSGNGARIIGRASEISATISRKGTTAGGMAVEIYRAAPRYLTVTGARMPDHPDALADIGADVLDLLAGFGGGADATATTAPEPRDDAELVRRIATGEPEPPICDDSNPINLRPRAAEVRNQMPMVKLCGLEIRLVVVRLAVPSKLIAPSVILLGPVRVTLCAMR